MTIPLIFPRRKYPKMVYFALCLLWPRWLEWRGP
jgi:hypothetical protein